MKIKIATAAVLVLLSVGSTSTFARDDPPAYGAQLMTQQERLDYRNRMQALKTQEEREIFRLEHHKKMQERAKERGVALPEAPPARGAGMGPGMGGMGPGMGGRR